MVLFPPPTAPAFEFRLDPKRGLTVETGGVPILRGSYLQVVSPDWTRSYYSSNAGDSTVEAVDGDTVRVRFAKPDVEGTQTYHREGDRLKVRYEFAYKGEGPAMAEVAAGLVWIPAFAKGSTPAPLASATLEARRIGKATPSFGLVGPLGSLEGSSSVPLTLFDARRYPQPWAQGKDVVWVGDLALPLTKGETTSLEVEWRIPAVSRIDAAPLKRTLTSVSIKDARVPDESRPTILPKPQEDHLDWNSPIEITGAWNLPIGTFDHFEDLKAALSRRFLLSTITPKTKRINLDGGVSKLGMNPGGYRITIRADRGVSVLGEEDTGLRNAVEKLAQMAFAKDGKLWLPTGWISDGPKARWRGVHLFGGPNARSFQKNLWTRVLRPLGMDHVVLQCERTAWDATPGIATSTSMTKAQLADLFALYRNLGVEATPLIQSFGHMEWLFANGKNPDLAMNPDVPYAIDPRKPRAKEVLAAIWNEAIDLAKPRSVHFGLDEVAMRGWTGGEAFLTDTWKLQLGFLGDLAQKRGVEPMLWGDQALAPGEAVDAALAPDKKEAEARRTAIPKYAWITDWHYKADPNPERFTGSLQLWKDASFRPIAAGWYQPDNVRGLALAATALNTGYLQTTWAGYESSEAAMMAHPEQFSAMVLAADYAWSGRREKPNELPYDADETFRKLYWGRPSPLRPLPGTALSDGTPFTVGDVRYRALDLRTVTPLKPGAEGGSEIDLSLSSKGRELDLALATDVSAEEGEAVAEVRIERAGAPPIVERLVYGRDLRALGDDRALSKGERTPGGPSGFRVALGKPGTTVTRIVLKPLVPYVGLRLMGAALVD